MAGDQKDSIYRKPTGDGLGPAPVAGPRTPTVYDEIATLLRERGWCKGVPRRGESLCLVAAIDEAVGVGNDDRMGSESSKLARAARIGGHLRDLLQVRNLSAWSDARDRTFHDIADVLTRAAVTFPAD
jgi:hypothetical protein